MSATLPPPPGDYQRSHKLIGGLLHKHHISCRDSVRLTLLSYDRPLTDKEKIRRVFHLLVCSICRRYTKQIKSLRLLVKRHVADLAKTQPREEFLQSLRQDLFSLSTRSPDQKSNPPTENDG
jgi:hypothetical protein